MEGIELIDQKVLPLHIVHLGKFIKLGVDLLMEILNELPVHHAFGEEFFIELLF